MENTMNAKELKERLEELVNQVKETILTNMPSKGWGETECHRQCLINRLQDFSHAVNDVEDEDLIEV
jgi:hypothetical protein